MLTVTTSRAASVGQPAGSPRGASISLLPVGSMMSWTAASPRAANAAAAVTGSDAAWQHATPARRQRIFKALSYPQCRLFHRASGAATAHALSVSDFDLDAVVLAAGGGPEGLEAALDIVAQLDAEGGRVENIDQLQLAIAQRWQTRQAVALLALPNEQHSSAAWTHSLAATSTPAQASPRSLTDPSVAALRQMVSVTGSVTPSTAELTALVTRLLQEGMGGVDPALPLVDVLRGLLRQPLATYIQGRPPSEHYLAQALRTLANSLRRRILMRHLQSSPSASQLLRPLPPSFDQEQLQSLLDACQGSLFWLFRHFNHMQLLQQQQQSPHPFSSAGDDTQPAADMQALARRLATMHKLAGPPLPSPVLHVRTAFGEQDALGTAATNGSSHSNNFSTTSPIESLLAHPTLPSVGGVASLSPPNGDLLTGHVRQSSGSTTAPITRSRPNSFVDASAPAPVPANLPKRQGPLAQRLEGLQVYLPVASPTAVAATAGTVKASGGLTPLAALRTAAPQTFTPGGSVVHYIPQSSPSPRLMSGGNTPQPPQHPIVSTPLPIRPSQDSGSTPRATASSSFSSSSASSSSSAPSSSTAQSHVTSVSPPARQRPSHLKSPTTTGASPLPAAHIPSTPQSDNGWLGAMSSRAASPMPAAQSPSHHVPTSSPSPPPPPPATPSHSRAHIDRAVLLSALTYPRCKLFTQARSPIELSEAQLDSLLRQCGHVDRAVSVLRSLDRASVRVADFPSLVCEVDEQLACDARDSLASALSYPRCTFFTACTRPIEIEDDDLDLLLAECGGLGATLGIVDTFQRAQRKFMSFHELVHEAAAAAAAAARKGAEAARGGANGTGPAPSTAASPSAASASHHSSNLVSFPSISSAAVASSAPTLSSSPASSSSSSSHPAVSPVPASFPSLSASSSVSEDDQAVLFPLLHRALQGVDVTLAPKLNVGLPPTSPLAYSRAGQHAQPQPLTAQKPITFGQR